MKRKFGARIGLVCLAAFMTAFLAGCGSGAGEKKPAQTEAKVTAEAAANQNSGADAAAEDSTTIEGGATMDDAAEILPNIRYTGTYREGEQWFAFRTGDKEDVPYQITLENLKTGSEPLDGYLVDKDGNGLKATQYRNGDNDHRRAVRATNNGTADTAMFNYLEPNATYYLRLQGKGKAEYSLRITDPNGDPYDTTAGRSTVTENDVFEPAANQASAPLLLPNTRYQGKYTEGFQWIAFRTGDKEDVPYRITLENLTTGSEPLDGYLVDEYGNGLKSTEYRNGDNDYRRSVRATNDGRADTAMFNYLEPNATYYLRLQGKGKAEYSLRITDPNGDPYDTTAGRSTVTENDVFEPAANQASAPLLLPNTRYQGKYTEGFQWIAFRTGDKEDVPYRITLENLTAGSEPLDGYLVDEYGTGMKATQYRNGDNDYRRAVRATNDGTADTAMFNYLEPNATYYLRLQGKGKAEYILTIDGPEETAASGNSMLETESIAAGYEEAVPGTSQSFALNIPLETKVSARYTDGYSWLAFTTNELESAEYYITLINCTVGSEPLDGYLVDELGNGLKSTGDRNGDNDYRRTVRAKNDGRADTAMFNYLEPNTTYYLRLQGKTKVDYTIRVSCPSALQEASYLTSSSVAESVPELDENAVFYTGTNQNIATRLKTNTRYRGKYENGYCWVSFTTGDQENAEYSITLENLTAGSEPLDGYLVDEYGTGMKATQYRNGDNDYRRTVRAKNDGTADTAMFNYLEPDTTYYLWIEGRSKAEYFLTIGAPRPEEGGNTLGEAAAGALEETVPEEVVFEVPFELNETQVRFKAESDAFIDPAAVEEALAPVAEIILQFPEHPILLAGTTATDGEQAARVELSERRAAAVKKVLVEKFAVPEEQLLTIGLGFEADPFERGRDRDSNGRFIETEGAKNRRVIVMDAESPVAKEILGTE